MSLKKEKKIQKNKTHKIQKKKPSPQTKKTPTYTESYYYLSHHNLKVKIIWFRNTSHKNLKD